MSSLSLLCDLANQEPPASILAFQENPNWGSQVPNFRLALRQELARLIDEQFPSEKNPTVLDLKSLPTFQNLHVSISHCPDSGLFVVSHVPVGIDLEITSRVKPELVQRICHDSELKMTSQYQSLWSAKESLFKAHRNLKIISETQILCWKSSQNGISQFEDLQFKGWVFSSAIHTLSLAIKKSST